MATYYVTKKYTYEIEAESAEEAEIQVSEGWAEDLGSLSPGDFGTEVE